MSKIPLVVALFLSVLCATSPADTVTLKSGEKLQGKISSEDASEVTLDIKVSDTISDQRVIRRDEIQKIEKTPPDDLDFEQIKDLKPDPLSAQPAVIDAAIGQLKGYLEKYPQSKHDADVKTALDVFQKEQGHLAAGEVKYFGNWISKSEAANRKVQLDGVAFYVTMRNQAAGGDFIGALNTFAQLDKNDSTTRIYPQAVALDCRVLQALSEEVNHDITKLKHDQEAWTEGVTVTPEPQKTQIIEAQKAEQDKYDALMDASAKSGIKWMPLIPRSGKNLDGLLALATTENARLVALPMDKMNASVQYVDKARDAMAAGEKDQADSFLKEAVALWPQNEDAAYLQKAVTDLKAEADKEAAIAAKTTPKPTAKPSASQTPKQAATPLPAAPADEEKPSILAFFMTIPGALCVVGGAIILLIIATVAQKLKKPKADNLQ